MFHCGAYFVRTHDLLEIDAAQLHLDKVEAPEWAAESLRKCPFVVVRRGPPVGERVPVVFVGLIDGSGGMRGVITGW